MRFANAIFDPLWNRTHIRSVEIAWKEDIGVGERGRYFDEYGIVRDVMQNHLLQILALVAMERPRSLRANAVRDEKVKVLRAIRPPRMDDVVVGQYGAAAGKGGPLPGYCEEKYIPKGSLTPTFAAAVLRVNNPRWRGVPFLITAGKALADRMTEIRIRFKNLQENLFCDGGGCPPANELVIRVQPDESIHIRIVNKVPGVKMRLAETELDLQYAAKFDEVIPDAYEHLLLDVMKGDRSLFIRRDELAAAWDVFTPVLHEMEEKKVVPEPYEFGSSGPAGAGRLAKRAGITGE